LGQIPSFGLAGRRQGELPEFTLCLLRAAPDRLVLDGFGLRLQRAGLVGERVDPEAVWGKFARDSLRWREMDSNFRFRCVRRS
jgi:hypothetical protein